MNLRNIIKKHKSFMNYINNIKVNKNNNKGKFVYLHNENENKIKLECKKYQQDTNKINTSNTTIYNNKQNEIGRLGELMLQEDLNLRGYNIKDNTVAGVGNSKDFYLYSKNGIELKCEVKVRSFDTAKYGPTEKWFAPLLMKEWVKMVDWHTMKPLVDIVFFCGYNNDKNHPEYESIVVYGFISVKRILELYTYYNYEDNRKNNERAVRYFPMGYKLGGKESIEPGILIHINHLWSYNYINNYLDNVDRCVNKIHK